MSWRHAATSLVHFKLELAYPKHLLSSLNVIAIILFYFSSLAPRRQSPLADQIHHRQRTILQFLLATVSTHLCAPPGPVGFVQHRLTQLHIGFFLKTDRRAAVITLTVASRLRRSSAATDHEFVIVVCLLCFPKLQFHLYRSLATVLPLRRRSSRRRAALFAIVHRSSG